MLKSESIIRTHFNQLRRWWAIGLATAATVGAVVAAFALGLPSLYRSSAYLVVDQAPNPLAQPNTALLELSGRLQAIRQEVLSRQRALELAEEFDLYAEERKAGSLDEVVAKLHRDVKVEPANATRSDGRMTTVSFRLSYTGTDPEKVAAVTNQLAKFYVQRNAEMRDGVASRTVASLKEELDAAKDRLSAQQSRVIDYTSRYAGALPEQLTSITTRHSQLTHQLENNNTDIANAMERRDALQSSLAVLSTGGTGADMGDPVARLAQATRELASLSLRFTDASVEVRNKRLEIAGLQAQIAGPAGTNAPAPNDAIGTGPTEMSMSSTLRSQISGWTRRIDALQKKNAEIQLEINRHDATIARAPVRSVEFDRINGELAPTRAQYEAMQARYLAALAGERAQQGDGPAEFQVADPALPAETPSAPNRGILLGLALLLAVGLGVGAVLVAENLDESFRSVDELRAFTTVPVLVTIPLIVTNEPDPRRTERAAWVVAIASVVLAIVSMAAYQLAGNAELVTRMLLR